MQVEGFTRVYAIADEDLERETDAKTSAVHFLRFELSADMITAMKEGARLDLGVDHDAYQAALTSSGETRASLARDFT